jgi:hypothetical protein
MNRLHTPRRFPMTLASLALLTIPFGCGSETQTTVEVPAPPAVVADTQPAAGFVPTPMPGTAPGAVEPPGTVDPSVRQAAGDIKFEVVKDGAEAKQDVRQAEGDVKKAVDETEDEAKQKAKAAEAEARKAAEDALDKLLPSPK